MSDKKNYDVTVLEDAPESFSGFCPIAPVPKGRPRFVRRGSFVQTYTPKETEKYENDVRKWMQKEYGDSRKPMTGNIYATYEFILPRPKSKAKKVIWSNTKPDVDNFVKSFQDGLDFKRKAYDIEMGVIENDSRVSCISATKRYAREGERPGIAFSFMKVDSMVIVHSPLVSDEAMMMTNPALLRVPVGAIDSYAKGLAEVTLVYLVVANESRDDVMRYADECKRSFPSLRKIIISHF